MDSGHISFHEHPIPPLEPYHKLRLTKRKRMPGKERAKRKTANAQRRRNRAA